MSSSTEKRKEVMEPLLDASERGKNSYRRREEEQTPSVMRGGDESASRLASGQRFGRERGTPGYELMGGSNMDGPYRKLPRRIEENLAPRAATHRSSS